MSEARETPRQPDNRQQKRESFQATPGDPPRRSHAKILIIAIAVLSLAAVYLIFGGRPSGGMFDRHFQSIGAAGQDIAIPIDEVDDGKARFYRYPLADQRQVNFFVVRSADGIIRAAFDACDVCFHEKRGYRQEGDDMICNNCGRSFPSNGVNEIKGGCNPAPLQRTVTGNQLVIKARDLQAGAFYF